MGLNLLQNLFGGSESKATSAPVTPRGVMDYYAAARDMAGAEPTTEMPEFKWDTLSGGDYERLEGSLYDAPYRRLSADKEAARNQYLARQRTLGMADDPATEKLWSETYGKDYAGAVADLAGGATKGRYDLQLQELGQLNPARQQYGWQKYQSPRDFWLNKMNTYYKGMGTTSTSTGEQIGGIFGQSDPLKTIGSAAKLFGA